MFKRFLYSIALALLVVLLIAMPVLAIADPDSPPQVSAVYVYEDLQEDGDVGVLIDYFLDYAATPDETATEAYMAVFIDTDGVTQLKTTAPYAGDTKGYGRGIIWIYFSAAEVVTYGLDSANEALYEIWLMGNPTIPSGWPGDPPKTIAGLDEWFTTGDSAVLLALRVLYYADLLEGIWVGVDLIESTTLGSRLTSAGEQYFENAIPALRLMAPGAFSAGTLQPVWEDIDYSTEFGAIMTDGTGTVAGSPITLAEGANSVNVTAAGTFVLTLERGTVGTVESDTGIVNGSPVDIVYGINTITVPVAGEGLLDVTVNLADTQAVITDTVEGTALDLTELATTFGMSRAFFSGLVWLVISVVICASAYRMDRSGRVGGKGMLLIFDVCIIAGTVLGLLPLVATILLIIAFGMFTGYVLFFRGANI